MGGHPQCGLVKNKFLWGYIQKYFKKTNLGTLLEINSHFLQVFEILNNSKYRKLLKPKPQMYICGMPQNCIHEEKIAICINYIEIGSWYFSSSLKTTFEVKLQQK